jgi:hypothetical protein
MKKPNITPGPWRQGTRQGFCMANVYNKHELCIASVSVFGAPVEQEANIKAIAALQDLLAALEAALSLLECANDHQREAGRLEYDTQTARAALIKAGYEF